ncbi:hypothetical protein BH10CYA1_BH10CYA1_00340 [soil metagenome]
MMFETLTGVPLLSAASAVQIIYSQMKTEAPTLKERSTGNLFPANVEEIVRKALRKNPDQRFQSMPELENALLIALLDDKKSIEKLSGEQISRADKLKVQVQLLRKYGCCPGNFVSQPKAHLAGCP